MKYIEPRFERKGSYIIEELQEFLEIVFFLDGTYAVGYSINSKEHLCMRYNSKKIGNVIGAYGCTFHKRAKLFYKTLTDCDGHFIRKENWHKVL